MLFKKLKTLSFIFFFFFFATPSLLGNDLISVTTKPITDLTIFPKLEAPATAISLNDAVISAEINGIILQLPLQVGESVQKGQTLAVIACKDYQLNAQQFESQLQSTRAKIDFTEWKLNRIQSLASGHNVSQEQLKELQSNLTSLQSTQSSQKAQLSQAKLQIDRCSIQAPFNAIVVERMADIGEMATPGKQIIRLIDNESIEVSAQLQANEVEKLKHAKNPVFSTKDGDFPVSIRASVGVYTERYRTQEVRCSFTQQKPLPGSVGRLVWQDNQAHLPAYLLSQSNHKYGIFIVEKSKTQEQNRLAKFIPIKDAVEGRPLPVPLELNADLALDGRYKLSHNDTVQVIQ
tara:strand:+ start:23486 stop:24529 length:1044 start_codon:yes stop_codon:yes gene_type:complete